MQTLPRLAIIAVLLLWLATSAPAEKVSNAPPLAAPGRLVDVGGWRLHIHCTGEGHRVQLDEPELVIKSIREVVTVKSPFAVKLDGTIPGLLQAHDVPGLAVGVIERGRASLTRGYGMAEQDAKRSMTEDTVLNFASISKPVTAWGLMHLVETRKLSLDAPIGPLLRRWALPKSEFDNKGVTVRRLLSHTAGISVASVPWFPADSSIPSLEKVLSGLAGDKGPVRTL